MTRGGRPNLDGIQFDVNLSILFTEVLLLERPAMAAAAGFDAVELWWPFAEPASPDRELITLQRALQDVEILSGRTRPGPMPARSG